MRSWTSAGLRRTDATPTPVSFGSFAANPLIVTWGNATVTVDPEDLHSVHSHYHSHTSESYRSPVNEESEFGSHSMPGVWIQAADLVHFNPPSPVIAQGRLTQRTVLDKGLMERHYEHLERAIASVPGARPCHLHGF